MFIFFQIPLDKPGEETCKFNIHVVIIIIIVNNNNNILFT